MTLISALLSLIASVSVAIIINDNYNCDPRGRTMIICAVNQINNYDNNIMIIMIIIKIIFD